jgi:hypothetical protein
MSSATLSLSKEKKKLRSEILKYIKVNICFFLMCMSSSTLSLREKKRNLYHKFLNSIFLICASSFTLSL